MNRRKLFILIGILALSFNAFADSASIDSLINSRSYIFKAETILSKQKLNQLYEQYDIAVNGNTTAAYLPYYGNGLTHENDELGIIFSSENFTYDIQEVITGWEVNIEPKDLTRIISVKLHIDKDGETVLIINDKKYGSVEYRGYLESYQE